MGLKIPPNKKHPHPYRKWDGGVRLTIGGFKAIILGYILSMGSGRGIPLPGKK